MAKKRIIKSRFKSIKDAENAIIKKYGDDAVYRLGDRSRRASIKSIDTGIYSLNYATGIGGFPRGRIVEVFGGESSGKTTLALNIIASVQKKKGTCVYIDAEHAIDVDYAERIGVDTKNLLISQPGSGEQALNILEDFVLANVDFVVVDSVANLVPESELAGEMEKETIGAQARLMSKALRRIVPVVGKSKTCIMFINQVRTKIGIFYGNPNVTPGGRALKFAASIRVELRYAERDKSLGGVRIKGRVVKNKTSAPYREFTFLIDNNFKNSKGIIKYIDKIEIGIQLGVLKKKHSGMIEYNGSKYRGMKTLRKQFLKDKKLAKRYLKDLKKSIKEN